MPPRKQGVPNGVQFQVPQIGQRPPAPPAPEGLTRFEAMKLQLDGQRNAALMQIAANTGPTVGHLPVVVPLQDGGYGVVCYACTDASPNNSFVFPCKVMPEAELWPTSERLVSPQNAGIGTMSKRLDDALKLVRSRWADQPSDSPEAKWLQELIGVISPS